MRAIQILWCFFYMLLTGCIYNRQSGSPDSDLRAEEGMAVAYDIESQEPGRVAGWGRGESMEPVFSDNTILVTQPIEWEDLEKGMMIAYFAPRGDRVVHSLIHYNKSSDTWLAKGINNLNADGGRVTRENLIGVVYASIQTEKIEE